MLLYIIVNGIAGGICVKDYSTLKNQLLDFYQDVRSKTEQLCQPLAIEDYVIQSIIDVSPPKWHLAHTTWFFETFILIPHLTNYQPYHYSFQYIFNSYYHGIGTPYPRELRGVLSRPTVKTIYAYRTYVDNELLNLLNHASEAQWCTLQPLVILGLHHEQQHQELLLMDIKHNFMCDPTSPVYLPNPGQFSSPATGANNKQLEFISMAGGMIDIGYQANNGAPELGFCFDNELPRHPVFLQDYALASRLVTNEEYDEFITAGGYQDPRWWLADGWTCVQQYQWQAPLYWQKSANQWHIFTLSGQKKLNPTEPVVHVSYYEADAYARFLGYRLPLEEEWENFVRQAQLPVTGNFMEQGIYQPDAAPVMHNKTASQLFGDAWEWTQSPYRPYPGYKPLGGALGEYNGKFMSNQFVLRGGCCTTPQKHIRASYRNFYQPDKRWQFSGIRLATDI